MKAVTLLVILTWMISVPAVAQTYEDRSAVVNHYLKSFLHRSGYLAPQKPMVHARNQHGGLYHVSMMLFGMSHCNEKLFQDIIEKILLSKEFNRDMKDIEARLGKKARVREEISRLYSGVHRRTPDSSEWEYWSEMRHRTPLWKVVDAFVDNDDFRDQAIVWCGLFYKPTG